MNKERSRKKILYVLTKSVWGGAQRYVFDLATHLPKERFDAVVAAGGNGLLMHKLREHDIRTIPIPRLQRDITIFNELMSLFDLIKIFVRERPDIVHLNSSKIGPLGGLAARIASLATGRRSLVIFTIHGWVFNEDRSLFWRRATRFITRVGIFFQDRIITINTADFETGKTFIPEKKLTLIRNGIQEQSFLPRERARAYLAGKVWEQPDRGTLYIGTIAELTRNKGLQYLIDSVNQIKAKIKQQKVKVIIAGDGEDKDFLRDYIDSLELQNIIFLIGFIPDAHRYLSGFDIFLLPSLKEGLPYVLMEAMSARVPIVATRVGGVPDLIEHETTGILVDAKDARSLAETVSSLLEDTRRQTILAGNAKEKIQTQFRLSDMVEKTIEIYEYAIVVSERYTDARRRQTEIAEN